MEEENTGLVDFALSKETPSSTPPVKEETEQKPEEGSSLVDFAIPDAAPEQKPEEGSSLVDFAIPDAAPVQKQEVQSTETQPVTPIDSRFGKDWTTVTPRMANSLQNYIVEYMNKSANERSDLLRQNTESLLNAGLSKAFEILPGGAPSVGRNAVVRGTDIYPDWNSVVRRDEDGSLHVNMAELEKSLAIPAEVKEEVTADITQRTYNMGLAELAKGRPLDFVTKDQSKAERIGKQAVAMLSELSVVKPIAVHLLTSDDAVSRATQKVFGLLLGDDPLGTRSVDAKVPPNFLSNENEIAFSHYRNVGGEIEVGGITLPIRPGQYKGMDDGQAHQELFNQFVRQFRTQLHARNRPGNVQDAAFVAGIAADFFTGGLAEIPGTGPVSKVASVLGKAARANVSPFGMVAERYGFKRATSAAAAAGTKAEYAGLGTAATLATSAGENLATGIDPNVADPRQILEAGAATLILGGAVAGTIHAAGMATGVIGRESHPARSDTVQNAAVTNVLMGEGATAESIKAMDFPPDIDKAEVYRTAVVLDSAKAFELKRGVDEGTVVFETMRAVEEDAKLIKHLDEAAMILDGAENSTAAAIHTSISYLKNHDIKGPKDSPNMKAITALERDPEALARMGDRDSFMEYVHSATNEKGEKLYADIAAPLEVRIGQFATNPALMRMEMGYRLTTGLINTPERLGTVINIRNNDVLSSLYEYRVRSDSADAKLDKLGPRVAKTEELLQKSVDDLNAKIEDGLTRTERIVNGPQTRTTEAHLDAIVGATTHIEDRIRSKVPIDSKFLETQLKIVDRTDPDLADSLRVKAGRYNGRLARLHDHMLKAVQQTIRKNYIREALVDRKAKVGKGEYELFEAIKGMDADSIARALQDHATGLKQGTDPSVGPILPDTGPLFAQVGHSIAAGKAVQPATVTELHRVAAGAKGATPRVKEITRMVDNWNSEVEYLAGLDRAIAHAVETETGSLPLLQTIRVGVESIHTPQGMARLEQAHVVAGTLFLNELENVPIPHAEKLRLAKAHSGDWMAEVDARLTGDNPYVSQNCVQNMIDNTKILGLKYLDLLDGIFEQRFGVQLPREYILGMYWNKSHLPDAKLAQVIGTPLARENLEMFQKTWSKFLATDPTKMYLAPFMNSAEMTMRTISQKEGLNIEGNFFGFHAGGKQAKNIVSKEFSETMDRIENFIWNQGGFRKEMSVGLRVYNGAEGAAGLKDTFFSTAITGEVTQTPLGKLFSKIFENKTNSRLFWSDLNAEKPHTFITELVDSLGLSEAERNSLNKSIEHLPLYIGNYDALQYLSAKDWTTIREHSDYLNGQIAKAHRRANEITLSNKKVFELNGFNIPALQWMPKHVYEGSNRMHGVEDFIDPMLDSPNISRRFSSDVEGQLEKTNRIQNVKESHNGYDDFNKTAWEQIEGKITQATTLPHRMALEQKGHLADRFKMVEAAESIAYALNGPAREKKLSKVQEKLGGGIVAMVQRSAATATGPAGLLAAVGDLTLRGVGGAMIATGALSRPVSLGFNVLSQAMKSWLVTGKWHNPKHAIQSLGTIPLTAKFWMKKLSKEEANTAFLKNYFADNIHSDLRPILMERISAHTETVNRTQMRRVFTTLDVAKELQKPGLGRRVTNLAGRAMDWTEDFLTQTFKENTENAMSEVQLFMGAKHYQEIINRLDHGQAPQAEKLFRECFTSMGRRTVDTLWSSVQKAHLEDDITKPFAAFLDAYHVNTVGIYGTQALSVAGRFIGAVAPNAARFLPARTNDLYRINYAARDTLNRSATSARQMLASKDAKFAKLPPAVQNGVGYLLASGLLYAAGKGWETGFGIPFDGTIEDKFREDNSTGLKRRLVDGTGVNINNLGLIRESVVGGPFAPAITGLMVAYPLFGAIFSANATNRAGVAVTQQMLDVAKTLEGFKDILTDSTPKMRNLKAQFAKLPDGVEKSAIQIQMQEEMAAILDEKWYKLGDQLLAAVPGSNLIFNAIHPITWAKLISEYELKDLHYASLSNDETQNYLPISAAFKSMGLMRDEQGRWSISDSDYVNTMSTFMPEETAKAMARYLLPASQWLEEIDLGLNVLMQTGAIDKPKWIDSVNAATVRRGKVPSVQPEPILPMEPTASLGKRVRDMVEKQRSQR